jgi:hypothetical protein
MLAPIEILSRHLLCPPVPTRITLRKFLKTTAGFQAFKTLSTRVASSDFQQSQYLSFLRQESRLPRIEMQSVHPEIHRWWPESMQVIHAAGVPPKRLSRWRSAWLLLNQPVWSPGVLLREVSRDRGDFAICSRVQREVMRVPLSLAALDHEHPLEMAPTMR